MVEKEHIWVKCQWTNQDPSLLARSPCPTWMGKLSLEPRAFTVHGLDLHQLHFQKPPDLFHLLSSGSPREPLPSCSLSLFPLALSHPLPASPPPHFAAPFPHSSSCWLSWFSYPLPSCSPTPPHKKLQINPTWSLPCFNPFKALPPKPGGNPNFLLWPGPLPTSPAVFNSQNSTTSCPPRNLGSHSALCPGCRYLSPPTCLCTVFAWLIPSVGSQPQGHL